MLIDYLRPLISLQSSNFSSRGMPQGKKYAVSLFLSTRITNGGVTDILPSYIIREDIAPEGTGAQSQAKAALASGFQVHFLSRTLFRVIHIHEYLESDMSIPKDFV